MEQKMNVRLKRKNSHFNYIPLYSNDLLEDIIKIKDKKCKRCGYTNRIRGKDNKIPCKNCGYFVFISDEEEFKYRVKEKLWKTK